MCFPGYSYHKQFFLFIAFASIISAPPPRKILAAPLLSMVPNFWCSLEIAADKLHLCFVIKANLWWKRTFLPMATTVVLYLKYMKLFTAFF